MLLRAPLLLARAASLRSPRPLLSSPRAHAAPSEAASPADLAAAAEASLSEAQPSLSPELAALAAAEARVAAAMAQLAAFEADARREEAARAAAGTADAALALANAELDAADAAAAAAAADRAAAEQAAAAASGPLGFVSALLYRQQAPATQLKASSKWAEPVDEDAERGQSGLAALVSGGAGATSHALPLLLLSGVGGFNPVDAAAVAVSCALFGVVYRYALRRDSNPDLKGGVIAAFGLTRGLAQASDLFSASGLSLANIATTDADTALGVAAQASALVGEAVLVFALSAAALEAARGARLLVPFGEAGRGARGR